MEIAVIGISYQQATIKEREYAAFTDSVKLDFYAALSNIAITQAVLVQTCNRSELYLIYEKDEQLQSAIEVYLRFSNECLRANLMIKKREEAVLHLFEVCAGFHSLALGEDQIAHQMQLAYTFATQCGYCQKEIHYLFQHCFASVKECKHQFAYNQVSISIPSIALQCMKQVTSLENAKIMIVGSGEMAKLFLTYLLAEPVQQIWICARRHGHMIQEVNDERIQYVAFDHRYEISTHCDVILSVTASPHFVFTMERYTPSTQHQLLMDLATPRDMDECLALLPNTTLYNLDDLRNQVDAHDKERKKRMEQALPMLQKQAALTYQEYDQVIVHQAMEQMQKKSKRVAQETYALLNRKLQLNQHEQHLLLKVLETSFLRMVKEPMQQLRSLDATQQNQFGELLRFIYEREETS